MPYYALVVIAGLVVSGCSSETCDHLPREEAAEIWSAAVEDSKSCSSDEQCTIYSGNDCIYSACGAAVSREEVETLTALEQHLTERTVECDGTFTSCMPSCADLGEAKCVNSRCDFVRSDGEGHATTRASGPGVRLGATRNDIRS